MDHVDCQDLGVVIELGATKLTVELRMKSQKKRVLSGETLVESKRLGYLVAPL